jgi:hypothetical protein
MRCLICLRGINPLQADKYGKFYVKITVNGYRRRYETILERTGNRYGVPNGIKLSD